MSQSPAVRPPSPIAGGRAVVALAMAGGLLLNGCGTAAPEPEPPTGPATVDTAGLPPKTAPDRPIGPAPQVSPEGFRDAPAGAGPDRYRNQPVNWAGCPGGSGPQCATIAVPLDRAEPDGQALTVSMLKVPATKEPKLGTLFVNPGGPGEPGQDTARSLKRDGLERYDIVGWDPRGTGASTPVNCESAELDDYYAIDQSPDDPAEREAYLRATTELGASCLRGSGELLEHIGTDDTVADLDLMRELVGDEKLHFLGYSYGTDIGSAYAQAHPDRVGKLVLDSAVNIAGDTEVVQASGFDRALGNFADWCVKQRCGLGANRLQVIAAVRSLVDELDRKPLKVGDRTLTQSLGLTGVLLPLYSKQMWPYLRTGVQSAREGDGSVLLELADSYNGRGGDGRYDSRMTAFAGIRCVDEPDRGIAGADEVARRSVPRAPIFAPFFGPDYTCATWPVAPRAEQPPRTAKGAAPILVVGTTGDSATPYEYAVSMAEQLESGVLLTNRGEGHTAYGGQNQCVNKAVVKYLTGEPPKADQTC